MSIEADTRWIIDNNLSNKHWVLNPNNKNRNVFFEGDIPNAELNKKLKQLGKRPDYILWDNNTNTPLGIIEAKKGGGDISTAFPQAIEYATILNAPLVFVMNNSYCQTKFITNKENPGNGKPLFINENEVNELIREVEALQFLRDNTNSIYTIDKEVIISRQELIRIFKNLNDVLRGEGLMAGIERLNEFANVLFVKLFCEKNNKLEIWDNFKTAPNELLIETFNSSMQKLVKDYDTELFTPLQIKKANTLRDLICRLDKLRFSSINQDVIGDAFEYFLQKATAGKKDLGEYFTPRHIVKTMVRLVNPLFKEKVYDPFCGTGGFLTESFNHIKENNKIETDEDKNILSHSTIYGNEITQNARLCKMNMILHGDGHSGIKRCNTLENPVDKLYDCIITNMPFSQTIVNKVLNHKTGKAEDVNTITGLYENGLAKNNGDGVCLLHCFRAVKDGGRMALVVPEGVLSNGNLKQVRKYLLDNAELKTIISLPKRVFQPYTDIKTNILYFVNCHTGKTKDKIWFFEVKSDGFTLDKYRKPTKENDLKKVNFINFKKDNESDIKSIGFELLDFEKVKESNYDLRGVVYRSNANYSGEYPIKTLKELCNCYQPKTIAMKDIQQEGKYKVFGANGIIGSYDKYNHEDEEVAVTCRGATCGEVNYTEKQCWITGNAMVCHPKDESELCKKYLYYVLKNTDMSKIITGTAQPQITRTTIETLQLPLPPLQKQQEIVAELDKMQAVIDGCKKVIENWKPQIDFNDLLGDSRERERFAPLEEVIKKPIVGSRPSGGVAGYTEGAISLGGEQIGSDGKLNLEKIPYVPLEFYNNAKSGFVKDEDILICKDGALTGKVCFVDFRLFHQKEVMTNEHIFIIRAKTDIIMQKYLFYMLKSQVVQDRIVELAYNKTAQPGLNQQHFKNISIHLPDISTQQEIVNQIEQEEKIIEENKKLIEIMENKMRKKIDNLLNGL